MSTRQIPSGTVSFLFTDIEGSTNLWDRHPAAMADAQAVHDELLRSAIESYGGYVFSHAGDGLGASFAAPRDAAQAAVDVQVALAAQRWPEPIGSIKVRMGMHAGVAEERDGDYFGTAVNRAARVASVGRGGQILLSDAMHSLLEDGAPSDWRFHDLGHHRLRDLVRAERLWQLETDRYRAERAALRTHERPGNLDPVRTAVVGRSAEIGELSALLDAERLVTLTGVGGVGKTTLARAVGTSVADRYPGGGWLVDLSALEDGAEVPIALLSSLDVTQRPGLGPVESIVDALRLDRRFVVVDNAEHVIDAAAALIDRLLSEVEEVTFLVTSREALAVPGEIVFPVGPLGVDSGGDAVELFIDRARRVAPDAVAGEGARQAAAEICRRLEGIPLAIELAAAQCDFLSPSEILEQLQRAGLRLEAAGRSVSPRHQSLAAAIRWSYDRLSPVERSVFDRLFVFAGGATVEAAEEVCSDDSIGTAEVRAAIRMLVRTSLAFVERRRGITRIRLLEPLRQFAEDRAGETGDGAAVAERHARYFAKRTKTAADRIAGPGEAQALTEVFDEIDNIRAAFRWAEEHRAFEVMGDLGEVLPHVLEARMRREFEDWASAALSILPRDHAARLPFALAAAFAALFTRVETPAAQVFDEGIADMPEVPEVQLWRRSFELLGSFFDGDVEEVIRSSGPLMDEARATGVRVVEGGLGANLALMLHWAGETERAQEAVRRLTESAATVGNPSLLAWARYAAGEIDTDPHRAIESFEESIEYALTIDNEFVAGVSLIALAATAGRSGDYVTSFDAMERSIGLFREAGNRPQLWTALRNLVEGLHELGLDERAMILEAAIEADREHASELFGPHGDRYRRCIAAVEERLGPSDTAAARERGRRLDYGDAAAFALESVAAARERLGEPAPQHR